MIWRSWSKEKKLQFLKGKEGRPNNWPISFLKLLLSSELLSFLERCWLEWTIHHFGCIYGYYDYHYY